MSPTAASSKRSTQSAPSAKAIFDAWLEPFKDQVIVVTGLFSDQAEALGDGGGDHSRACGNFLTGVHVKKSDSLVENAVSMDQIVGKAFERETQLSSLQMTADENSLLGSCDLGYSCAYSNSISWRTPSSVNLFSTSWNVRRLSSGASRGAGRRWRHSGRSETWGSAARR